MIHYYPQKRRNPQDVTPTYYPQIAPVRPMNLEDISEAITEVCTVTRHDIKAVLSALQEQVIKAMQNGQSIRLGDLGSFRPTLSSNGVPTADEVSSQLIRSVNCRFTPGTMMHSRLAITSPEVRFGSFIVTNKLPGGGGGGSSL